MPVDITYNRVKSIITHNKPLTDDDKKQLITSLSRTILNNRKDMMFATVNTQDGMYIGIYRKQDGDLLESDLLPLFGEGLLVSYMLNNQTSTEFTVGKVLEINP